MPSNRIGAWIPMKVALKFSIPMNGSSTNSSPRELPPCIPPASRYSGTESQTPIPKTQNSSDRKNEQGRPSLLLGSVGLIDTCMSNGIQRKLLQTKDWRTLHSTLNYSHAGDLKSVKTRYCDVALPVPLRTTFTYALPAALNGEAVVGRRVVVPFRNRPMIGVALAELGRAPPTPRASNRRSKKLPN